MAPISPLNDVIRELNGLLTQLHEFLLHPEKSPDRPGWSEQLEQYARKILVARLLAGQGGHIGVHDACMRQQDYVHVLMRREVAPTSQEWNSLERWPLLLLSCLTTPVIEEAVDELMVYVRNTTHVVPLDEHEAQALRRNLLIPAETLQSNENNIVTLPVQYRQSCAASTETAVRYLLQHELHDIITEYSSVADLPTTTIVEHAQALRLCVDRIQLLGISAAGSDLIGLMDCCLLCHDALITHLKAHGELGATGRAQIKIWADLISRYLDSPASAENVDAVLNFYRSEHFIPALSGHEYDSLRGLLLIDPTAQITPQIEIRAVPEHTLRETSPAGQVVAFLLPDSNASEAANGCSSSLQ